MSHVFEMLRDGAPFTFIAVALGMLALGVALLALVASGLMKRRTPAVAFGLIALLMSLAPIAMGVVGYAIGLSRTEQAVAFADAEFAGQLRARGREESFANIIVGGACTSVPLLLALGALGLGLTKRSQPLGE